MTPVRTNGETIHSKKRVEEFILFEVGLLDARRFDEWADLFTEDGLYWIPIDPEDDPYEEPSIIFDDAASRAERVYITTQRHYAQLPPSRTIHYVTNVTTDMEVGEGSVVVGRCNMLVAELRPGDHAGLQRGLGSPQLLAMTCEYRLRPTEDGFKIAMKKIILLNRDLPIPTLSFLI